MSCTAASRVERHVARAGTGEERGEERRGGRRRSVGRASVSRVLTRPSPCVSAGTTPMLPLGLTGTVVDKRCSRTRHLYWRPRAATGVHRVAPTASAPIAPRLRPLPRSCVLQWPAFVFVPIQLPSDHARTTTIGRGASTTPPMLANIPFQGWILSLSRGEPSGPENGLAAWRIFKCVRVYSRGPEMSEGLGKRSVWWW